MGWIKYNYTCQYQSNGVCICDTPYVEVELSYEGKSIKVMGLIDSGCTTTNINKDIASFFGIDLSKCKTVRVGGVGGAALGFQTTINMQLKDHGDKFEAPVIFTENLPVLLLLGQYNFFEKFKIKFEKHNNTFELSRV